MRFPHFHSSSFGDNPPPSSLLIAHCRSDSGAGGLFLGSRLRPAARRLGRVIRASANLAAQRLFGVDVDACRAYGRYLIASAIAHRGRKRPTPFVFTTLPDLPNSSPWRPKTKSASPLHPELGRGRNLHASAQAAPLEATAAIGGVR